MQYATRGNEVHVDTISRHFSRPRVPCYRSRCDLGSSLPRLLRLNPSVNGKLPSLPPIFSFFVCPSRGSAHGHARKRGWFRDRSHLFSLWNLFYRTTEINLDKTLMSVRNVNITFINTNEQNILYYGESIKCNFGIKSKNYKDEKANVFVNFININSLIICQ